MAMIFERTMMFGFTFRSDMPTSAQMLMLAPVVYAWTQRLKYFAKKMNRINRTIAIAINPSTTYVE